MKTVIIVSKCLRVTNFKGRIKTCEFHFKGAYAGEFIRKVTLNTDEKLLIKKGEEYLMYVQLISFLDGVLTGTIIKAKRLEDCWDKS